MVPSRALRISSSEGTGRSLTALAMTRCFPNCPARRSCGVERGLHFDDGDQFFEHNLDQSHRILGLGAGLRDNGNHWLTLPTRAVYR